MNRICSKTNRSIIMGISIIPVILCHITQFIGEYKNLHSSITDEFLFVSAAVGVDVFFFFSLVGLGYSFRKNSLKVFYKNRLKRIYPSYMLFLIVVPCIFYTAPVKEKIILFLEQVSGASIFFNNKIEWYLPSLIVLYASYPLLFKASELVHRNTRYEILCLMLLIFGAYPLYFLVDGLFAMRLPLYFLAIITFLYMEEGRENNDNLIALFLLSVTASFFIKNQILSYALIIPLFLYVLDSRIDRIAATKWGGVFSFLGKYTLQIYLAQIIATKYLILYIPTNNIPIIVILVLITTAFFAIIFYQFEKLITKITSHIFK